MLIGRCLHSNNQWLQSDWIMAAFQQSMATINQFQFKFPHRITATNTCLFKFGLKEQNYAPSVQKLSDL